MEQVCGASSKGVKRRGSNAEWGLVGAGSGRIGREKKGGSAFGFRCWIAELRGKGVAQLLQKKFAGKGFLDEDGVFRETGRAVQFFRVAGNEDYFQIWEEGAKAFGELRAAHVGHDDVGEEEVDGT